MCFQSACQKRSLLPQMLFTTNSRGNDADHLLCQFIVHGQLRGQCDHWPREFQCLLCVTFLNDNSAARSKIPDFHRSSNSASLIGLSPHGILFSVWLLSPSTMSYARPTHQVGATICRESSICLFSINNTRFAQVSTQALQNRDFWANRLKKSNRNRLIYNETLFVGQKSDAPNTPNAASLKYGLDETGGWRHRNPSPSLLELRAFCKSMGDFQWKRF